MLLYSYTERTSVETKQEIETLQETISSLNIQLKEKDENIKGMMEQIDCPTLSCISLSLNMCLCFYYRVGVQRRDSIKKHIIR